jgi:hypothetical protein
MKFKQDKFRNARGGRAQLLELSCEHCGKHICYYQKDGPGVIRRLYQDRMNGRETDLKDLECAGCGRLMGVGVIFEKEKRKAYRLIPGAVVKQKVKLADVG